LLEFEPKSSSHLFSRRLLSFRILLRREDHLCVPTRRLYSYRKSFGPPVVESFSTAFRSRLYGRLIHALLKSPSVNCLTAEVVHPSRPRQWPTNNLSSICALFPYEGRLRPHIPPRLIIVPFSFFGDQKEGSRMSHSEMALPGSSRPPPFQPITIQPYTPLTWGGGKRPSLGGTHSPYPRTSPETAEGAIASQ